MSKRTKSFWLGSDWSLSFEFLFRTSTSNSKIEQLFFLDKEAFFGDGEEGVKNNHSNLVFCIAFFKFGNMKL